MNRPGHVFVAGQQFDIDYTADVDSDSWGRTYMGRQGVEITEGLGHEQERDTVLHELLHICIRVMSLHRSTSIEEERLVAGLTPVLLDALKSNVDFTKYLLEDRHR